MKLAKSDAIFMHCLPVGRGEEVTDEVIDGKQSVVWRQGLNRVHAQKSIIKLVFELRCWKRIITFRIHI